MDYMIEEKVLIDKETLKAIAVDTRLNILKLLAKKKYTLSDLSNMLGLGNSTIKEHMDHLVKAGLVEKEETERKWKFYSITLKGRRLVEPREIKVLFAFVASFIAAAGYGVWFAQKFLIGAGEPVLAAEKMMAAAPEAADYAGAEVLRAAPEVAEIAGAGLNPVLMLIILIALFALSMFLLGYYLKKKVVIIQQRDKK